MRLIYFWKFERTKSMEDIIFIVEESEEGGFTAKALGNCIFTEADTYI